MNDQSNAAQNSSGLTTESPLPAQERSPLPWEAFAEKIVVATPERMRVVIRAANSYRVAVEDNPVRWEQALADFEFICAAVNALDTGNGTAR